jgi:hypothetical protein
MVLTPNANALITSLEFATILQLNLTDADYVEMLINIASDRIKTYIGFDLKQATYTDELYSGNARHNLYLRKYPIISVTTIKEWDTYNNLLLYTYTENLEYLVYLAEGYIYMRSGWEKGHSNYKITYSAGYAAVPYDVKMACAMLANMYYDKKGSANMKSETIGNYSYTTENGVGNNTIGEIGIPPMIAGILNKYRCPIVSDDR